MDGGAAVEHDRGDEHRLKPWIGQPRGHGDMASHVEHGDDEHWQGKDGADDDQTGELADFLASFVGGLALVVQRVLGVRHGGCGLRPAMCVGVIFAVVFAVVFAVILDTEHAVYHIHAAREGVIAWCERR